MSSLEDWKVWEGRSVDGRFPLKQWLGGSDHSAVFLTERNGQPAAIKLLAGGDAGSDRKLAFWRSAVRLSHPNLVALFESGRCQMEGSEVLYVVMEHAEEDLAQILPQRALTASEVSDMLPPVLDALGYVHEKGFVHGRLKPSNIQAAGDRLKLATDHLTPAAENTGISRRDVYDAPEAASGNISAASDVWSLGVTLVSALTQKVPFNETAERDPQPPSAMPQPFRGIARECLRLDPLQRCSLADIRSRLEPAAERSVPAKAEPAAAPQRKRRGLAIGVAVAATLLSLIGIIWHGRSGPPQTGAAAQPSPFAGTAKPASAPEASAPSKSAPARGAVVRQVLPEISRGARSTIRGKIRIVARVEVDSSGIVTSARLTSPGHSKYFASQALKAAEQWEFSPPVVNGQPAASVWMVQFRISRKRTEATFSRLRR